MPGLFDVFWGEEASPVSGINQLAGSTPVYILIPPDNTISRGQGLINMLPSDL